MIYYILFIPDEGDDIFGSLGEPIGIIPQIWQVIDVGEAVLVL